MLETPVFSTAAVAAPHTRAAEIGQSILASGGNAVEAVVAMAATCSVVLPHLNGLGGDGFFVVREPRGRVHGLDASGPAGTLATIERYRKREYEIIPAHGPDAALTVAGVVAGWALALDLARALGGQLPLDMLMGDAIRLAREGCALAPSESRVPIDPALRDAPHFAATFLVDGKSPRTGTVRRQPKLADTLERLSHAGLADFYRGDVGREIALDLERIGSPICGAILRPTAPAWPIRSRSACGEPKSSACLRRRRASHPCWRSESPIVCGAVATETPKTFM